MRPTTIAFLFFFCAISVGKSRAQCPITVDAGADQFVCQTGEQTPLNGNILGNYLGFVWSPASGLDDPQNLTPNATVTGPMTYTLTGFAEDPSAPNLVVNPAFENGNTGFFSTFAYDPMPIFPGTYYLTTSPSLINSNFPPCDDHTFGNGTGNMMFVNGTGNPADIWCETVSVNPNSYYVMSGWVAAAPLSPPSLQFSIDGTLIGSSYAASGAGCSWEQFSASWFSGPNVSITLCVTDQSSSGNGLFGDFFALDDIYFAEACSASDEVMVDVVEVEAVLPTTTILTCNSLPGGIMLDGSASSSGADISYQWTTASGNIVSGGNTAIATVDAEGIYTLTVNFNNGSANCSADASIEVLPDPNFVIANATVPINIDCNNPTVTINGSGSSEGPTISYEWTPLAGIISGETTLFPEVATSGTYTLTVTNSISGCTATAEATVLEDTTLPMAVASSPGNLACQTNTLTLSGLGSSTGAGFSYLWTTSGNGQIVSGETTLNNCVVAAVGIYQLAVTNQTNGCVNFAQVEVMGDVNLPTAQAAALDSLDCENATVQISGNGSSTGSNISYLWTTDDGHIVSGANMINAVVDSGGVYVLTVSDNMSGCEASDTIIVLENREVPFAFILTPDTLSCLFDSIQLDGTMSSTGPAFSYLWTTATGNILSGDSTLTPFVDLAGTYQLLVADTTNGCSANASTDVVSNLTSPVAEAGPEMSIGCDGTPEMLDGSGSSTGANFTYLWTTNDGSILFGETTLIPEVDAPGLYFLATTDLSNGCFSVDSVLVSGDGSAPLVFVEVMDSLDCIVTEITIDASVASNGPNYTILWETTDGHIVSGETTLSPLVDEGGTYQLTISDVSGNCSTTASIEVVQDTLSPLANIAVPALLTCNHPTDTLDGTLSSQGPIFSLNWTTSGGNFISGENTLSPIIDAAGFYFLTITNEANGCLSTISISVSADFTPPVADAGQPFTLPCGTPSVQLDGTGSAAGPTIIYEWTTLNGNIVSGQNSQTPEINAPGTYIIAVTDENTGCSSTDTVVVNADGPVADAGLPDTLSCFVSSINLDGTGSDAGPNIIYFWSTQDGNIVNGETTLTPEIDAPGTYLLTVTDISTNCQTIASVQVSFVNDGLDISLSDPVFLTCTDTVLEISASSTIANAVFSWTTIDGHIVSGETTATPLINAPGEYEVTVTDPATGCSSSATLTASENTTPPTIQLAPPVLLNCNVVTADLDGTGSSTGPSITYAWSTPDGNLQPPYDQIIGTAIEPGTYVLTITDATNGCTAADSITVMENATPPNVVVFSSGQLGCGQTSITLFGNGSSTGSSFSYLWTTPNGQIESGATTLAALINAPGDYTLTVTNAVNGCTNSATLTIPPDGNAPSISILPPDILTCINQEVIIDASSSTSGFDYSTEWTTQDGNFLFGETTLTPGVDAPGTYILTITNTQNGCSSTDTIIVLENTTPPQATAGNDLTIGCDDSEIEIQGSLIAPLNAQFSWGFDPAPGVSGNPFVSGLQTSTPWVNLPGTYTLTVTDPLNGCVFTDEMTVAAVSGITDFSFEIVHPNCQVPMGSITFTGTQDGNAPYSFSIDGVVFAPQMVFENLPPATYQLYVQDADGCEASTTAQILDFQTFEILLNSSASAPLGSEIQLNAQVTTPLDAIASINWTPAEGLSCTDCLSPVASPTSNQSYLLEVMDTSGCTAQANINVTFTEPGVDIFVPNAFSPNDDGINDFLTVFANGFSVVQVKQFLIFDRWGGAVFEAFDFSPNNPESGWDGKHKGRLLDGAVFVWLAEVALADGSTKLLEGEVVLVR
ncbi:MAG: gliding motility-associated C-terminal domain-containing protein [Saprospiraceae bacterium]